MSLPPCVSLPSSIMFSDLPQISFYVFICLHLDLSISLLPLWSKVRRGSWHSPLTCLHSLQCRSETEEQGRVRCSRLRAKVLDSESIWSFPWWAPTLDCCGLCCSAEVSLLWWLDPWDFLVWMTDLKVITFDWVSQNNPPLFYFYLYLCRLLHFQTWENCSPYLFNELVCLQRRRIPTHAPASVSQNVG